MSAPADPQPRHRPEPSPRQAALPPVTTVPLGPLVPPPPPLPPSQPPPPAAADAGGQALAAYSVFPTTRPVTDRPAPVVPTAGYGIGADGVMELPEPRGYQVRRKRGRARTRRLRPRSGAGADLDPAGGDPQHRDRRRLHQP